MESVENDTRSEEIADRVKESLAEEGKVPPQSIGEATTLINKAVEAAETEARLSHRAAEEVPTALTTTQTASTEVARRRTSTKSQPPTATPYSRL